MLIKWDDVTGRKCEVEVGGSLYATIDSDGKFNAADPTRKGTDVYISSYSEERGCFITPEYSGDNQKIDMQTIDGLVNEITARAEVLRDYIMTLKSSN